jgi:uncharacterized damage-inducible protein DinB
MITPEYLRTMALYNRWQNDVLFGHCAALNDDLRTCDHGMFFGSIHRTLDHVRFAEFAELRRQRLRLDEELEEMWQQFDARWLNGKASSKFRFSRGFQLTQMFNHQTHHRSQVTSQLFRLGIDYGPTDMTACPYY